MITAAGCCAFAGGFTWGLKEAGITPIAHLEFPGVSAHLRTCRRNFPEISIYDKGPESWPLDVLASFEPDIVYAQPPCAPWSPAGYGPNRGRMKHRDDPRVEWTKAAFRLVDQLQPKVYAYESVQQTYFKTRDDFLNPFALDCNLDGKTCYHILLDGARVGLPHHRKRYFFVASDYELPFTEPPERNAPASLETLAKIDPTGEPVVWPRTVDKTYWENRLEQLDPGQTLLTAWKLQNPPDTWSYGTRGQVVGRPAFGNYRLHPDKPPRTFFGSYTIIHPTEDRPLTMSEIKAIAGYPPEFDVTTAASPANAMVQLGQAVMPPVARWLGEIIVQGLQNAEPAYGDTIELDYC